MRKNYLVTYEASHGKTWNGRLVVLSDIKDVIKEGFARIYDTTSKAHDEWRINPEVKDPIEFETYLKYVPLQKIYSIKEIQK